MDQKKNNSSLRVVKNERLAKVIAELACRRYGKKFRAKQTENGWIVGGK